MKRLSLLILCLLATSFLAANNECLRENTFQGKNENSIFAKNTYKKAKESSFIYTYIGSDGCTFTISVRFNLNEENGQVDYSEVYMESGCGNGDVFVFYGWSNYIKSTIVNTHLTAKTPKEREIIDNPDFIKQFNAAVESNLR